ncbi:MAG: hypothetical protein MHM6MM_003248 [Cercozoa sp. M6MM]
MSKLPPPHLVLSMYRRLLRGLKTYPSQNRRLLDREARRMMRAYRFETNETVLRSQLAQLQSGVDEVERYMGVRNDGVVNFKYANERS